MLFGFFIGFGTAISQRLLHNPYEFDYCSILELLSLPNEERESKFIENYKLPAWRIMPRCTQPTELPDHAEIKAAIDSCTGHNSTPMWCNLRFPLVSFSLYVSQSASHFSPFFTHHLHCRSHRVVKAQTNEPRACHLPPRGRARP